MVRRLTWQKSGQSEGQLREYLILALLRSGVCVTLQDGELDYLYIANLPEIWNVKSGDRPTDAAIFGGAIAARLEEMKGAARTGNAPSHAELQIDDDHVFDFHVEAVAAPDGSTHILTTIVDLSEKQKREKVLRALLREMSHRSKNLLAIIQSIASQTAKHTVDVDGFLRKFRGRLYSLSRSQDLVTDSSWRGAFVKELIHQQLDKYAEQGRLRISVSGDDVLLSPNAALHVGLALHELIVNAVSHGAGQGRSSGIEITIATSHDGDGGAKLLELTWREPVAADPAGDLADLSARDGAESTDRHFGSVVLERIVPASVNGKSRYEIGEHEITYELKFPLTEAQ
ncbi:MAG: sensor histidine kinase [Hyphomicrobiales bacterium]|nr:MAG: sensor histidine kinase [Hyphomicrobiales bacterium]